MRNVFVGALCMCGMSFVFSDSVRSAAAAYFSHFSWVMPERVVQEHISWRYKALKQDHMEVDCDVYAYRGGRVFPRVSGMGVIDHTNIPHALRIFCEKMTDSFMKKKIDPHLCQRERKFLPHYFSFRMGKLPRICAVVFAQPNVMQGNFLTVHFKLNVENEDSRIIEVTVAKEQENWKLFQFLFKEDRAHLAVL
ncbi:hypothetical protein TPADAL_0690 [Treponema pallidum subsp. pallidum DAL-1]|uniref:Uncharacterized protein TP_0690 n=11 Tax=Treponemataceae TaxID=2845253 RepID=Y690_TREPA|nr:hypothetical protein [Treponema pallidum]O83688.1 RecName: Full=Uncharacterized protein TP_0690; Flags: Precursor [Treponema pallidum subsp. pallidum str. Nichols]ACD71108.1 hypothetical protein TPASS_0690 [Treponema pallidum subsp. pallidum SS14]ADD72791.1 conserved hypothetical protein [Treponema pallidum subsp. pallidum str. Chicago]AEH40620.1 hypothetical protein TPCCA_0690 [Treponema paraluiscuniculi Cuniculi A]AEZ57816.1 probable lipoprotein [Treponema pallidum subsp. pertenue str. Sa